jgi:hypothetical protein
MTMFAKSTKVLVAALATLVFVATASAADARVDRSRAPAISPGAGYPGDEVPWTFACIKDHGTSRCNDLN